MLCRGVSLLLTRASYASTMARSTAGHSAEYKLVDVDEVSSFAQRCLVAAGALQPNAAILASVLVHADVRGHYSHGLNRLGKIHDIYMYMHRL